MRAADGGEAAELARTLTELAEKSQRVAQRFFENQAKGDGFQIPDPGVVADAFAKLSQALLADPARLVRAQIQLWQQMGELWQHELRKAAGQSGEWEKYIFIENLHSPFGVQLIGDTLYVANTDNIMKYRYTPGETRMSDPGVEFTDLPSTVNHHWTKALLASPDGKKLYVGVGSNSNVAENGLDIEYRRATVLEVDVQSAASRIYASGIRNPTGLGWEPTTGKLWAIVNERDEIGADLVPDYLTSVQEGGFYGWPYSYYGQHMDQRVQPQRPDLVARAIRPDYALGSHVAPLGLWFYQGRNLPEKYHGGAFIGQHGSWNRTPLSGYDVVFVRFKDGKPEGVPEPIVTGFASADQKSLKGAPVGLAEDVEGALLIADDVGNTIWRVTAHGTDAPAPR